MKSGILSGKVEPATHWAIIGLFVLMAVGALSFAQSFFIPVVFAVFLALIFSPVRRWLGKAGIGPAFAGAIIMTVFCLAAFTTLYVISNSLATILSDEPQIMNRIQERLQEISGVLEPVREAGKQIEEMQANNEGPERVVVREEGIFSLWAETTPYVLGQAALAIVLATFLIGSGDMFYEKLVRVMPTASRKRTSVGIAREVENQLSTYFLTIFAINLILGVVVALAMWALGMPDPVFFGVIAFALNFIPYVGSLAGIGFAFVMALVTFDSLFMTLAPPFVYWLINTAEGQFITPVAVGRRLKLNAVAVFLSLAFWAWLWSFVGMFLSTPMLIALKAFTERTPELSWLDTFLQGRTECDPEDNAIVNEALDDEGADVCDAPDAIPQDELAGSAGASGEDMPNDDEDDRLAPAIT
ncbi:AI-2E family transporter [Henriciella marina]|uniref:AI-2E family transporter n=1 Tax=Henriciella marina TaxID=453851 RepID=A0ABT4LUG4_9PROT|nr:AI-2E family transporter [Henriciella marina]MCH2458393.1 AI-2E family transporter [Henriciella sp.]MCZ4298018.1 AI-2E family transporter [Henriciella marina]